jgi:hypothetical protein
MSLTAENELIIRKGLADTNGGITEAGYVIPAPMFFNDRGDFWSTVNSNNDTQFEIETTPIAATWIYPLQPVDNPEQGSDHSPLVDLTYEFYQFRSYAFTREDESETPDIFGSKVLAAHNLFTKGWVDIKAAFQGKRNMTGLPEDVFAIARTTSVVFPEFIQNRVPCLFIPGVVGFAVKMQEKIQLMDLQC